LGVIEQWGNGINRIINACKYHGLEAPRIAEKNDFFDVEIIRPVVIDYDRLANDATDRPPDTVGKPSNSLGL